MQSIDASNTDVSPFERYRYYRRPTLTPKFSSLFGCFCCPSTTLLLVFGIIVIAFVFAIVVTSAPSLSRSLPSYYHSLLALLVIHLRFNRLPD
jgi:hypothetical protein